MAYAFKQSSGVAGQVRDIAIEQIDKALEAIAANEDFDQTVHTLRKSCKKLRALLKLVRPVFAEYEVENDAFRAIADRFSVARDAAAMVQTMSGLVDNSGGQLSLDKAGSVALLDRLRERARHLRQQMGEEELLTLAAADFNDARTRVPAWQFDASGIGIVQPGLKAGYRRFRKRLAKARKTPEGEVVHEWRKATKVWWYHMRLYERTAPAIMENLCVRLDELGETLGDHHNLMVLADWIVSTRAPGDSAADSLLTIIAEKQASLSDRAFDLGEQLAAERPGAASERFDAYWQLLE
ncbi:CHAD domain-containing protein [Devosia subaequoris]|uniref:CHAD domain-containing protein n=1 Tax=Devosia subaequoris TaxID=395930 RepID=A0A7W6NAY3_9HYPH|nr:CHAD domain-containing protein [Devosia subaequoris]MBB4051417.1 CHAD domain-containing protein [Devosia subaequoris]MCP1209011.1 CHAD domain-containing protein [Devosia subaequoris]